MLTRTPLFALIFTSVLALGCTEPDAEGTDPAGGGGNAQACPDPPEPEPQKPVAGFMHPTRVLRRMTISLRGDFPARDEYQALLQTPEEQRDDWLDSKLDELLAAPTFYDRMLEFARGWLKLPPNLQNAMANNYGQTMFRWLRPCPEGTLHAGHLFNLYRINSAEDGCDVPAAVVTVEPWWAPGTTVTVAGQFANLASYVELPNNGGKHACGRWSRMDPDNTCGCGPNLVYCTVQSHSEEYNINSRSSPHRQLWEEPARLFAHIAWHDRPATDWFLGDYTVGPKAAQSVYVRHGRSGVAHDIAAAVALDQFQQWWRNSEWTSPNDPHHDATDPLGWSEFEIHTRQPLLVKDRHVTFDPRVEPAGTLAGMPSAGMLTSIGVTTNWPRERVRAARLLEVLACENFTPPPAEATFVEYVRDPDSEGPCLHCHTRIGPAAIHFKRFTRTGGIRSPFAILGVGSWQYPPQWRDGNWPYDSSPWTRMARLWDHDMRMTPVTQATIDNNPDATWIDYLPPDQTLFGQTSDGTIGPLGFGKLIAASGVFDRCLVRRLHENIVGRDIDPQTESGYLKALVKRFVDGGREIRPLVRTIVGSEAFRRGL